MLTIKLEYLRDCGGCGGCGETGRYRDNERVARCPVCDGAGLLPTEEGKKLAEFLFAFYGLRPLALLPCRIEGEADAKSTLEVD